MVGVSFCLLLHGEHCISFRKGMVSNSLWGPWLFQRCLTQVHVLSSSALHWVLISYSHTSYNVCLYSNGHFVFCMFPSHIRLLIQRNHPLIAVSSDNPSMHCGTVLKRAGVLGLQQIGLLFMKCKVSARSNYTYLGFVSTLALLNCGWLLASNESGAFVTFNLTHSLFCTLFRVTSGTANSFRKSRPFI